MTKVWVPEITEQQSTVHVRKSDQSEPLTAKKLQSQQEPWHQQDSVIQKGETTFRLRDQTTSSKINETSMLHQQTLITNISVTSHKKQPIYDQNKSMNRKIESGSIPSLASFFKSFEVSEAKKRNLFQITISHELFILSNRSLSRR